MPDREKVIKCLELCRKLTNSCEGCPYENVPPVENCMLVMHDDALELLKEQEAVEPTLIREGWNKNYNDYVCPRCDNGVVYEQNYCSECGVQFLWEGR